MVERDAKRGSPGEPEVWLALETSTGSGSVGVWSDGLAFEETLGVQGTHSERLLPAIDRALDLTGTRPEEVAAFVVGSGPGSFTGVRVAAAVAKGWAMARRVPLFAYSSLLAVAAGCAARDPVCALFDARRGQVYAACYDLARGAPRERLAPGAWTIGGLLERLQSLGLAPRFAGEGASVYQSEISKAFGAASLLPSHLGVPRAASLLWLRSVAPDLGRIPRPESWEPVYLRDWRVVEEGARG